MFGLRLGKLGTTGGARWTEQKLWPLGATSPGMWIDPPYVASLFSTSAGTTAISAIGTVLDTSNPVGLALDRKGGLALGPELNSDVDFNTPASWTPESAVWVVSGGKATYTNPGSGVTYLQSVENITLTAGKRYRITYTVSGITGGGTDAGFSIFDKAASVNLFGGYIGAANGTASRDIVPASTVTGIRIYGNASAVAPSWSMDSLSIKEIPGIHLSQATATSRPVASARVNWLTQTEALHQAPWSPNALIPTPNQPAWDGKLTACKFAAFASTVSYAGAYQDSFSGANALQTVDAKADGVDFVSFIDAGGSNGTVWFNLLNGTVGTQLSGYTGTITSLPNGWFRCVVTPPAGVTQPYYQWFMAATDGGFQFNGDGVKGVLLAYPFDGPAGMPYQRVGATAADYDASVGPTYLKFDGVDDSLASATFAAGTLTSSMGCLVAVRRDSAANAVCGLYNGGAQFGYAENGSGAASTNAISYTSVFVDGTQLTGGSSVTAGTLHTALSPGAWHIMEYRGLNLSTLTGVAFGRYGGGYEFNGALGEIQLFASGQDVNRDKARAQLAAYFGVTLP